MTDLRVPTSVATFGAPMGIRLAIASAKAAISVMASVGYDASVQVTITKNSMVKTDFEVVGNMESGEEPVVNLTKAETIAELEPAKSLDEVHITLLVKGFDSERSAEHFHRTPYGERAIAQAVELLRVARGDREAFPDNYSPHAV